MNTRQVHLDFHTSEKIEGIGEKFDKRQFQNALIAGHINSITVFSKCHHGWAYHPSKANEMHPHLNFDLLKAQIEAAHEIGVKTPVYLSAGFDEKAAVKHPDWIADDKEHTRARWNFTVPIYKLMCMNSPYLDYFLAQIKEVCENYDADAIFLDIVGVRKCYCANCIKTLLSEGKDPGNDNDVLELAERVYANYTKRVRETIDGVKPGLPVFHNGGHIRQGRRDLAFVNSHLELESLPTGGWGYDHFPMSARYAQTLGLEYLGMTGKFHTTWGEFGGFKHPNALRYETALCVANGAKCSIGDQLAPNGYMDEVTYNLIGKAYSEIEQKEEWIDNVLPVADIAVITAESVRNARGQYQVGQGLTDSDKGVTRILLEGKYLFNIVDIHEDLSKYKLVILADDVLLSQDLYNKIRAFVSNGGKILASGKSGLDENEENYLLDFNMEWLGESEYNPDYVNPLFEYEDVGNTDYIMYGKSYIIKSKGAKEYARKINSYFNRTYKHFCSHYHSPSSGEYAGPGIVSGNDGMYISWNIFEDYALKGELIAKRMVQFAIDEILGNNITLKTTLPSQGVTTLMKQNGRLIHHLLYAVPTKRGKNVEIIEDIIPLYNVEVSLKCDKPIKRVYLAPQKEEICYILKDGRIEYTVPRLECHQMVVIEY